MEKKIIANTKHADAVGADSAAEALAGKTTPDPEVVAVAHRRTFTAGYKQRIVREADACATPGGVGEILRREGLYSSHLSKWRQEIRDAEIVVMQGKTRGPKFDAAKVADRRVLSLEMEVTRLRKKLGRAEQIIDAQKKLCELLDLPAVEAAW